MIHRKFHYDISKEINIVGSSKNESNIEAKVPSSHGSSKKYFCIFCKALLSKLPLHLEKMHKEEPEVRAFCVLPKGM